MCKYNLYKYFIKFTVPLGVTQGQTVAVKANGFVNKTNGESSPLTSVDGMLKFKRTQPRAEIVDRSSNIPSRFVNEAFTRDEFDDSITIDLPDEVPSHPKSLGTKTFLKQLQ